MILPAFGIVSHIIETFSRKPIFGYSSMVYALASIAILSFVVWAHHMFTVGMPLAGELFFMYSTMLIAIPTGVKVFNWVATMFRGSMTFETPNVIFNRIRHALYYRWLFRTNACNSSRLSIPRYCICSGSFHYVLVPGALFGIIAEPITGYLNGQDICMTKH